MAFEPKTWACGDTITAQELNRMEQGIDEASDKGYECTEGYRTVFEDTVTTSQYYSNILDFLSYNQPIEGDALKVVFDGTEYTLPKSATDQYGQTYYGEYVNDNVSFENYPLAISTQGTTNVLYTPNAGTYELSLITWGEITTASECFEKAVKLFTLKNIADAKNNSVVENDVENNIASGNYSHAEGNETTASGDYSHAEGSGATASGMCSHAEGNSTTASGDYSHAEGNSWASGYNSHAEGTYTKASGTSSHAEGATTAASGTSSHAEGAVTTASGDYSHAEGSGTIANHASQHVFGEYNIVDPSSANAGSRGTYVEIVGNGNANSKSNARTLDWSGNEVLQGSLTLGKGTADETTITATQLKALLALLNS